MPIYQFKCPKCGRKFEDLLPVNGTAECCGVLSERQAPTCILFGFKACADPANDDSRARYKAWVESDRVKAQIKSGGLRVKEAWES